MDSHYEMFEVVEKIREEDHRFYVGDHWDLMGKLQFDFLREHGLLPRHTLMDIGCGCLRGGVKYLDYLDNNRYYGLDVNKKLILKGVDLELSDEQREKITDETFIVSDKFEFDERSFDYAIAFSLFTHLSENKIKLCLRNLKADKFYATFFIVDEQIDTMTQVDGVETFSYTDPYHYTREEITNMGKSSGWNVEFIGEFGHIRGQQMVKFYE
jgi:hypothetical protein